MAKNCATIEKYLKQLKREVILKPDIEYDLLGVKWYGKGVFIREKKLGNEIKAKKLFKVNAGDFIYNRLFAWKSSFAIIPEEYEGCLVSGEFPVFIKKSNEVNTDFLLQYILLPHNIDKVNKLSTGMSSVSRKRFKENSFLSFQIPDLDKNQQKKISDKISKHQSINQNIDGELDQQQSILKQLRQAILQEAVEGKLTAQWRKQNPELIAGENHAARLLEQIKAEKERLVKEGKIKKQKPLPPVSEKEKPFELPEGWVWCRLGELCDFITKGTTPSTHELKAEGDIPFLKVYNIVNQKIDFLNKPQFINRKIHEKFNRSKVYPGDVLMNIVGPPLGKVAIVPTLYPEWNINQALAIFRPLKKEMNLLIYLYLVLGFGIKNIHTLGVVGQDNISLEQCRNIFFPLSTVAEQKIIVEKVNLLMAKIDALEEQVKSRKEQAEQLMQAVLREAFTENKIQGETING